MLAMVGDLFGVPALSNRATSTAGMTHGEYLKHEVHNLGRFISTMKFRPLEWRTSHPYVLVDRLEDITNQELIRQNPKTDRTVCLYGYTRGAHMKQSFLMHIPGLFDVGRRIIPSVTLAPISDDISRY